MIVECNNIISFSFISSSTHGYNFVVCTRKIHYTK